MKVIPAYAVRSVYRSLVRHARHLNDSDSILDQVRAQFRRRAKGARLGHVRAAFELEKQLRQVLLGDMTLEEVRQNFSKDTQQRPEKNAESKIGRWVKQPERRLDAYNYPPTGTAAYRVDILGKLANLRARYIQHITRENMGLCSADRLDHAVIDTVFAPAWRKTRTEKKSVQEAERRMAARAVSIRTIVRTGKEMSLIRVQGRKARLKGFARHMKSLDRDRATEIKRIDEQIQVAKAQALCEKLEDNSRDSLPELEASWTRPLVEQRTELVNKRDQELLALEVRRRILIKRAERLQNNENYYHRINSRKKPPRGPVDRLHNI